MVTRRWRVTWALAALLLLGGALLLRSATREALPFDAAHWQHPDEGLVRGKSLRQRMLADLLRHPLVGLPRDSLERMLGPAPMVGFFGAWDMAWWLGPSRRYVSLGSEWLVIKFDSTGRVARYAVLPD